MEELLDAGMSLLAGSTMGIDNNSLIPTRQQDNVFAEDDDNYEE